MKYLKKYNEDINWDWVEEEENEFDFSPFLKNDIPIKVYQYDWYDFEKEVQSKIGKDVSKFRKNINDNKKYIYIYLYDMTYLDEHDIRDMIKNHIDIYNINKVVEYKK